MFRHPFLEGEGGAGGGGDATPMITVQYNGAEVEVPRPAGYFSQAEIAERYVPKATHDATMGSMRTKLESAKNKRDPNELLEDETFRAQAIEKWGLNPNATQKQFQEQLANKTKEITEREIVPLKTKLSASEQKIEKLRTKDLFGQIVQGAAANKVEENLLKPTTKKGVPMVVSMLRDSFAYDEETDSFYAKGENGFAYSQTGEAPYMTVGEFIAQWVASDGKPFVRGERQSGAEAGAGQGGSGTPVAGQVGKELRLTADQIRDITFFKKMEEKARKEGLTIVPV
jgi:hypothetical protein